MYRKYLKDLESWFTDQDRKPLIVWGARQVGKTYLIKDLFAKKYFKDRYIYIDCATNDEITDYIHRHTNVNEVINYLSLKFGMEINKDTLLIFDEAQECLPVITLMKYFCQDRREIPVIVTGSMVRIKIQRETKHDKYKNKHFLFPVGKINQLTIYQLNFEEYLINRNKVLYQTICTAYQDKKPLPYETHQLAFNIFYEYLLLGGMPEVIDTFLKETNYQRARKVLIDLYDNYLDDMQLYQASNTSITRTRRVFSNIYSQLNKENKNFKCSQVVDGATNRDLQSPLDWLSLAYVVKQSYLLKERVTIPFSPSNESLYRLYLMDMGLFTYQSKENATTFIDEKNRNTLSGIYFENYVAVELAYNGFDLYYWKGKDYKGFEFIIESNGTIYPIDVKKNRGTLNSLEKYSYHNKVDKIIKVSKNNYGYDEQTKILTIPFYYFFLFLKELKEGKNN